MFQWIKSKIWCRCSKRFCSIIWKVVDYISITIDVSSAEFRHELIRLQQLIRRSRRAPPVAKSRKRRCDEILILINITHSFHIILYAEIRFLIMKYWALISKFLFFMLKRIWSRWREKKNKKIDFQSSSSSSFMIFFQIHFSAYAFSFAISFAASFASYSTSYSASYSISYSAQYASQYSFQYASSHDFASHAFASHVFASHVSQHSNRFEKILHSSRKSVSISHVSFNSMKDHDLKIYINWHIQSKSQKWKILRFALNQLSEQKYDLQTIQTLKNAENRVFWQELNILSSIKIQLIRNVNKFDREMTSRKRMSSSSSISSFQKVVERDELLENKKMTIWLSIQNLQFTSFKSFTQNTMSFSQKSTQNENDDETERIKER